MIELHAVPFDAREIIDPVTGAASYDRVAVSEDYARWAKAYIGNGVLVSGGGSMTDELKVSHTGGLALQVATGAIAINGRTAWIDSAQTITADQGESQPRIDRVIMELNLPNDRGIYLKILKGTAAASPQPPALTKTEDVYQMSLCQYTVAANAATITNIVDERADGSLCGISNVKVGISGESAEGISVSQAIADKFGLSDSNRNVEAALMAVPDVVESSYFVNPYQNRVEIKTSQNWVCPAEVTRIACVIVGGGGGGLGVSGYSGGYGSEFQFHPSIVVNPGTQYKIVIGAGGAGRTSGVSIDDTGGDTTAFGFTAKGGSWANANTGSAPDYINGMKGQNTPTQDPYSGILYSAGGRTGQQRTGNAADNTGNGGNGNGGRGGSGVVVIYY